MKEPKMPIVRQYESNPRGPTALKAILSEMFNEICAETPSILANWDKVKSSLMGHTKIPVEIYEMKVVPNAYKLIEQYGMSIRRNWLNNAEFIIQAMVNKIELPIWMIVSVCAGLVELNEESILKDYSDILVNLTENQNCYDLQMNSYKRGVNKINWRILLKEFSGSYNPRLAEHSLIGSDTLTWTEAKKEELNNRFQALSSHRNGDSLVAKFFWIYLENGGVSPRFYVLPKVQQTKMATTLKDFHR
tara:strand:- start:350 stop:1090 length:741 start_codon:yes stop_codon:yes gene_type:complete